MRRWWIIAAVVGVVGIAAAVVVLKMRKGEKPAAEPVAFEPFEAVEVVEAHEVAWRPTSDLVGTVVAKRSVILRNELAGVVRYVGFESGQIVEENQDLIRLDDTLDQADLTAVKAAVRVAEANVKQIDAEIKLAKAELDRLTGLQSRAIAEVEIDRAQTRLDTAQADRGRWVAEVDQANARVAQVEARISKLTIKAPFRARVGMRAVHEGQYLAEGVDIAALQEVTDTIYLDFAIPQEYAPRVTRGTTVMATAELLGPDPVRIEVVAVDAIVNNETRNLRVRAEVDNKDGRLVPGMAISVRVPIEEYRNYVVVPSTAIRRAAYGTSIFVIEPDESGQAMRARQRFVTLGPAVENEVIVLDGLKPGDRVAGAGSFKLRDGVKVMVQPPGTAPGGPTGPAQPAEAHATGS